MAKFPSLVFCNIWCFAIYVYIVLNVTEPNTFCQHHPFLLQAFYVVTKTRHASIQPVRVNGDSWWPLIWPFLRLLAMTVHGKKIDVVWMQKICVLHKGHLVRISSCTETQWKIVTHKGWTNGFYLLPLSWCLSTWMNCTESGDIAVQRVEALNIPWSSLSMSLGLFGMFVGCLAHLMMPWLSQHTYTALHLVSVVRNYVR